MDNSTIFATNSGGSIVAISDGEQLVAGFPAWVNLSESSYLRWLLSFLTKMAQVFLVELSVGAKMP
jgi:hypothetical protein